MFQEKILENFLASAVERHRIYLKKESGEPKPWTNDPIYQNYFFCNVFRQYDKCSKWIIENIVPIGRWDLIILYRFISTYKLFEEIKKNRSLDNLENIESFLGFKKCAGEKLFNGCFIRNPRIPGGWTETYKVPFILIEALKKDNQMISKCRENSLEIMVDYLKKFPGVGGFMGYEYACDFEYTETFIPIDKYTWANKGPGAMKGMSYLVFGNSHTKINDKEWLYAARQLYFIMKNAFSKEFPEEDFSMREVEHWLCEYQKYRKYSIMYSNPGHRIKHRKYLGGSEI